jgi:hypothetical protein
MGDQIQTDIAQAQTLLAFVRANWSKLLVVLAIGAVIGHFL